MKPVVFLGPTLDRRSAAEVLDADYRPPAMQGDVLRAVLGGASVIGLIDGYFERVPSVWHKEILFALAQGVPVYGASSMGALRASELHSFGMRGIGAIFRCYHDGENEDDDEVAIQHGPAEVGYSPLSEAMVNIRATVATAVAAGVLKCEFATQLLNIAKSTHYKERTYARLVDDAKACGIEHGWLRRFEIWLTAGKIDQKRLDALEMLMVMAEDQKMGFHAGKIMPIAVEESLSWRRAREFVDALNRRDVPRWHFSMLSDNSRVEAFQKAIQSKVRLGDLVLDIGTGSGLLAMFAAKAGASHVFACEGVPLLAQKAREIIAANGFSECISVLDKWSMDLVVGADLPEKADVLISEIVDHVLIGEGIIPTFEHALAELVKPAARIIPECGRLFLSAFECDELHTSNCVSEAGGLDISQFNEFSPCGASTLI